MKYYWDLKKKKETERSAIKFESSIYLKSSSNSLESKMNFRNFSSIVQKLLSFLRCLSMIDEIIWCIWGKYSRKMEDANNLIISVSSYRWLVFYHWKYHVFKGSCALLYLTASSISPDPFYFGALKSFFIKAESSPLMLFTWEGVFRALHSSLSMLGLQQICYFAEEYLLMMSSIILSA